MRSCSVTRHISTSFFNTLRSVCISDPFPRSLTLPRGKHVIGILLNATQLGIVKSDLSVLVKIMTTNRILIHQAPALSISSKHLEACHQSGARVRTSTLVFR